MLFGIFIILFGVSSTALTTFGKTNNQPPPTHVPIGKKPPVLVIKTQIKVAGKVERGSRPDWPRFIKISV